MLNSRAIKELCRQYHLAISPRRMGQNFLVDPRILERIAQVIGAGAGDKLLEIGAGLGALTEALLSTGAELFAVERDAKFVQVLTDRFKESPNLKKIVQSDILELSLEPYASGIEKSLLVVGNIPFSMTSPILEYLLKERRWVKRAILTIQKEVAQRIVAKPSTKEYSSITLLVAVAFQPSIAFLIPPNCFYPQPKVTSAVLQLDPLTQSVVPPEEEEAVLKLVRLIFTHRRKTLLNALSFGSGFTHDQRRHFEAAGPRNPVNKRYLAERLLAAGLDPVRRPETLSLRELTSLQRTLSG